MRLWSLHPKYLDWKGLGGVWREGLLGQAVLQGRTKGWKKHSQLERFKNHENPIKAIGFYLLKIYEEAYNRGYNYNKSKIVKPENNVKKIKISQGQLLYEFSLLKERLKRRSSNKYKEVLELEKIEKRPAPHSLFVIVDGDVEPWEKSYWKTI